MGIERVSKPSDWLTVVEEWATKFIAEYPDDKFKVGKVKYEPGGAVGPDELCKGVLTLDVQGWYVAGEPWPTQRPPSAPFVGETDSTALTIVLRYVSCIEGMGASGAPVAEAKGKAQQKALMDLGWATWRDAVATADKVWRKHFAAVNIGNLSRLPDAGNGTGFTFNLVCKLGPLSQC